MGKLTNLTVKGQVTIPKDVRDALGLKPGEPVEIEMHGPDAAVLRKGSPADADTSYLAEQERLRGVQRRWRHLALGVDVDAYMAELREPVPLPNPEDV